MTILHQQVGVKTILTVVLGVYLAALMVGYLIVGPNPLFDGTTAVWALAIGVTALVPLQWSKRPLFAQMAILMVVFHLFLFPRLLGYLFTPDLVVFPFDHRMNSEDVNRGLFYILVGTVSLVAGFLAAEGVVGRFDRNSSTPPTGAGEFPLKTLLTVFLLITAFDWFITNWLGVSHFGKHRAESWNTQIQILKGLFSIDMACFLVLAALFFSREEDRAVYGMMALTAIVYILFTAFNGSRSGGLAVLMMIFSILLGKSGNFRSTLGGFVAVILFFSVLSWLIYPVATQVRIFDSIEFKKMHDKEREYEPVQTQDGTGLYADPRRLVAALSNRLAANLLDQVILVRAQPGEPEGKSVYINIGYALKNVVNYCVPGMIFPEAELNTSRVMPIIYGGFTQEYVKSHGYFSQIWSAWGLAYALFGWWGGIVALFGSGFALHAGYLLLMQRQGRYLTYITLWYLFLVPKLLYLTSGLDHSINTALVRFLQAVVILGMFGLGKSAWGRIVNYRRAEVPLSR